MTNILYKKVNPWYITGLCEGEATFTYSRSGNFALNLYFAVKLAEKDKELIEMLHKYFNVGKIYKVKASIPKKNNGFTKKALYYRVSTLDELKKIVEHFDKYPLWGQKQKQYQTWKEILRLKTKHKGNIIEIKERLEKLLSKLSELSPRNQPWEDKNVPAGTVS